jgi:hypothetical protein
MFEFYPSFTPGIELNLDSAAFVATVEPNVCIGLLCCTAGLISTGAQDCVRKLEDVISCVMLRIFYGCHVAERFSKRLQA